MPARGVSPTPISRSSRHIYHVITQRTMPLIKSIRTCNTLGSADHRTHVLPLMDNAELGATAFRAGRGSRVYAQRCVRIIGMERLLRSLIPDFAI